ncbi:MAG TPA: TIGR01777 family oxidoreductase, partial [Chitinophagaceae bacterium]|nr:TIGR01777 family oxidoreductase [Chitinophagaceae bacterium]
RIIILTREKDQQPANPNTRYAQWDVERQTIDVDAIRDADHIIHLAGAGVADKRWTDKRKKEIVDSRVKSGELLVKAMQQYPNKIKTIVSASAIGWYGPDDVVPNLHPFTEYAPAHDDFLGQTCAQWEAALEPVTVMGKRLVKLRTGIVLSRRGGALAEFKRPLKFGVATILGNGKQVMSWIHIDDLVEMYILTITNEQMRGPYNAVAPNPVTNKQLVKTLAKSRKRFYIPIYVPSFVLKLVLEEMSIEVLKSATVSSGKMQKVGFVFQYPTIESALKHL